MSSSKATAGLGSQPRQPPQKRISAQSSTQTPIKRSKPSSFQDYLGPFGGSSTQESIVESQPSFNFESKQPLFGQSNIKSGLNTSGLFGQPKIIRPSAGLFGGSPPTESSFKVDLDKIHKIVEHWSCEPSEIKGSWEEGMVLRRVQKILEEASYKWKERSSNLKD
jgi:hypothetical protein